MIKSKITGAYNRTSIVSSIPMHANENIVISVQERHGQYFVDIRVWTKGFQFGFVPTKKAINCHAALLPTIISALQKLNKQIGA